MSVLHSQCRKPSEPRSSALRVQTAARRGIPYRDGTLQVDSALMAALLTCFAAKALRLARGWLSCWAIAIVGAAMVLFLAPEAWWWCRAIVTLGAFLGNAGSCERPG